MSVYNRLFTKILDSSIWLEPSNTRIVWVTLLAAMDEDGYAHFSAVENLAARARVSVKDTQKAIDCFLAPDANSENPENDGRRIERVPGGFLVLNALEYREKFNREIMREKTRLRVAEYRANKKGNIKVVTKVLPSVTPASASESTLSTQEGESEGKPFAEFAGMDGLIRVRKLFNKRNSTPLDKSETAAWQHARPAVTATTEEQWQLLEWAYAQNKGDAAKYRRKDMATLLNNWNGEFDRAAGWRRAKTSGKRSGEYSEPPLPEGFVLRAPKDL